MDAGAISTLLNQHKGQLENNCFDQGKIKRLFEQESIPKRIIRMIFGFDAANYQTEWFLKRHLRKIFHCQEPRAVELTRLFINCFDDLEQKPVAFGEEAGNYDFQVWMEVAGAINTLVKNSICPMLHELGSRLEAKRIGMQYRIEKISKQQYIDLELHNKLINEATEWNKAQFNAEKSYLSKKGQRKIAEVCQYSLFATFLVENKSVREDFFKWIIRDNNDVASFVEFSGTMDWMGSVVTKRFGGFSEVRKIDNIKVLGLPFEGKYHSVLDRNKVITLANNYQLSISQIVKQVQDKRYREGNINFYATKNQVLGFINWHIQQVGSYNPATQDYERIDISKQGWEKKVPLAVEYSQKKFYRRFHKEANLQADQHSGYGIVLASRSSPTLDIDGTHGWYGYAYPTEHKTYSILHTGQFGDFPEGLKETLTFVANTTPGVIAIHDDNLTYLMRHSTCHATRLYNGASEKALQRIADKIMAARKRNLIFQIGGQGCAGYAAESYAQDREISKAPPINIYGCLVTDSRPKNICLEVMRKIIALSPRFLQPTIFQLVMLPLLPCRGCVTSDGKHHSLTKMPIWKDLRMSHPGWLPYQQEIQMKQYVKNEITWENAHYLNHWDEHLLKEGKFIGFLQKIYDKQNKIR